MIKSKKQMWKVVLKYDFGLSRSIFVRARSREEAERTALKREKHAIAVDDSFYPPN